jgi:nicotinamide mononucleotide transporter
LPDSSLNPLELLAVALGLINITLLVRRSIWNFPFGIAMVLLYARIFTEERLYAEAGLQLFFAAVQLYGWRLWARAGGREEPVAVESTSWPARIAWLAFIVAASLALGTAMDRWTDAAMPYTDSSIAAASVSAQILLSYRRLENWLLWIAIDVLAIVVYLDRGLLPTAGLYGAFLILSLLGLLSWSRVVRERAAPRGIDGQTA